jgi:Uma2 family endonuclease
MSIVEPPPKIRTLADMLSELGDISPDRILMQPAPGTATEDDLLATMSRNDTLCELVDGVLVEKAMGYESSLLAMYIGHLLQVFILPRNLGLVTGADGAVRLFPGLVRIPDLAFASWDRFPDRKVPRQPIPTLTPDLAVEVLSQSNTPREMERKLRDYFSAGVRLVWIVDPFRRVVSVYNTAQDCVDLQPHETLDGEPVLSGFQLPLTELFAELDRTGD